MKGESSISETRHTTADVSDAVCPEAAVILPNVTINLESDVMDIQSKYARLSKYEFETRIYEGHEKFDSSVYLKILSIV